MTGTRKARGSGMAILMVLLAALLLTACSAPAGDCELQCGPEDCGLDDGCGGICPACEPEESPQSDVKPEDDTWYPAGNNPVLPAHCGPDCQAGQSAGAISNSSSCVCIPWCFQKECGSDGCGGSCGQCELNEVCIKGACFCAPDCTGKVCGDNGCGDSCGE